MATISRSLRIAIAWRPFTVGDAVTRPVHAACEEVPTVLNSSTERIEEGQPLGHHGCQRIRMEDEWVSAGTASLDEQGQL